MILYTENPKDTTKLLDLINKFGKTTGYKFNTQKHVVFLYTKNKPSAREIKKTIQFTITKQRKKYLGINIPKEAKDFYLENFETLM